MSSPRPRKPFHAAVAAVLALALVLFGVVVGLLVGPLDGEVRAEPAPAVVEPVVEAEVEELRGLLDELGRQVRAFQATARPEPRPVAGERPPPDLAPERARQPVVSDDGVGVQLDAIDRRLVAIEENQRRLMQLRASQVPLPELTVPSTHSVREYLAALKEWSEGEDVVRAHMFWTPERISGTYGEPDEIKEHDDYIEWIYRLPGEAGRQFDFHFVNGLCVQAH